MNWIKKLIKKHFKLIDVNDLEYAFATLGNATDRPDYEWKLKQRLFNER